MDKLPHISIILPVYNAEKTLEKCLNSIIQQNYIDFELIIINDGSEDNSLSICQKYQNKDNRIKLYDQKNKGVSAARNMGLDNAIGKYICFVDADDWIEKEYLSAFFRDNIQPEKEIVIQNCFEDTATKSELKCNFSDKVYITNQFSLLFTELNILEYGYPFAKLYQVNIINQYNLRFDTEIHFIEDLIFFLNYLQYIETVRIISEANYHYTVDVSNTSLSYSHNPYESEIQAYYTEKNILETLTKKYNLDTSAINYWKVNNGFILYRALKTMYRPQWKINFKERITILHKQWNTENIECLKLYSKQSLNSLLNRLSVYLYINKWIRTYDTYMSFFVYIKYKLPF